MVKIGTKQIKLNLKDMTTGEKLQTIELLWGDFCPNVPNLASPDWQGDILKEREKRVKEGTDRFVDWRQAKNDIRNSIS